MGLGILFRFLLSDLRYLISSFSSLVRTPPGTKTIFCPTSYFSILLSFAILSPCPTNGHSRPAFPVCRFTFADGRRCTLPASAESNGLCYPHTHAAIRPLRRSDLVRVLSNPDDSPPNAAQIQRFLAKLPRALAEGLITQKEVRNFIYLRNVLLQCERASKKDAAKSAFPKKIHPSTPNTADPNETNHLTV